MTARTLALALIVLGSHIRLAAAQCSQPAIVDSALRVGSRVLKIAPTIGGDVGPSEPEGALVRFVLRAGSGGGRIAARDGFTLARAWITVGRVTHPLKPRPEIRWSPDSTYFDVSADSDVRLPPGSRVKIVVELRAGDGTLRCLGFWRQTVARTE